MPQSTIVEDETVAPGEEHIRKISWQWAAHSGIITIRKVSGAAEFDLKGNISLQGA